MVAVRLIRPAYVPRTRIVYPYLTRPQRKLIDPLIIIKTMREP